jgi:hypothetical protein
VLGLHLPADAQASPSADDASSLLRTVEASSALDAISLEEAGGRRRRSEGTIVRLTLIVTTILKVPSVGPSPYGRNIGLYVSGGWSRTMVSASIARLA